MGYDAARASVESRWLAQWTADSTTLRTPTVFGDTSVWLTRVDGTLSTLFAPHMTAWVRVTIRFAASATASLGPGILIRTPARIWLQLFAPKKQGRGAVDGLADLAVPIFEQQQFDGLTCWERQWMGEGDEEQWFTATLSIPFEFDEVAGG